MYVALLHISRANIYAFGFKINKRYISYSKNVEKKIMTPFHSHFNVYFFIKICYIWRLLYAIHFP